MGYSKQEYWSELSCPPPGDLPDPGIEPTSLALAGEFFTTSATWEAPNDWICKDQINYCLLKCSSYCLNLAMMVLYDVHRHLCTPGIPTLRKVGDSWSTEMTNPLLTGNWLVMG